MYGLRLTVMVVEPKSIAITIERVAIRCAAGAGRDSGFKMQDSCGGELAPPGTSAKLVGCLAQVSGLEKERDQESGQNFGVKVGWLLL